MLKPLAGWVWWMCFLGEDGIESVTKNTINIIKHQASDFWNNYITQFKWNCITKIVTWFKWCTQNRFVCHNYLSNRFDFFMYLWISEKAFLLFESEVFFSPYSMFDTDGWNSNSFNAFNQQARSSLYRGQSKK